MSSGIEMSCSQPPDASKDKKKLKEKRLTALTRIIFYSLPEASTICTGLAALVVNSITNLSFPWVMGRTLDEMQAGKDFGLMQFILNSAGFFLVGSTASWLRILCLGTASDRIASRLRQELFETYLEKDLSFFDTTGSGELVTLLDDDVDDTANILTENFASGLRSLNSAVNGSILLYMTSPRLSILTLSMVPMIGAGAMLLSKYSNALVKQVRELQSQSLSYVLERLGNITTVRLNQRQEYEKERYRSFIESGNLLSVSRYHAKGTFMSFINFAVNASLVGVLREGGLLLRTGQMTAGSLTRFATQTAFVGLGFAGLATFYSDLIKSLDAAVRVFDTIDGNKAAQELLSSSSTTNLLALARLDSADSYMSSSNMMLTDDIKLKKIVFAYPTRPDRCILRNVSVIIRANKITCFAGKSGSGKSTLVQLICGLQAPQRGRISIGARTISADALMQHSEEAILHMQWLRENFGVVQQTDNTLMSGSIKENIAYGKEGATQKEIEAAAQAASAHEFIINLPQGYDTEVGNAGSMLSGGQRARIALARALVKDPAYLLLDEVTSSLDVDNERAIIDAFVSLRKSKTIIVITHSEAVKAAADVVYEISEGSIVSPIPSE